MESSNSSSISDLSLSEPNDAHIFESIDLNSDRETLNKMCKINEAAEQADLNRFRYRLQHINKSLLAHSGVSAPNKNADNECQSYVVGYGHASPSNGKTRENDRNRYDTTAQPATMAVANEASGSSSSGHSSILAAIKINNLRAHQAAEQNAEEKIQAALKSASSETGQNETSDPIESETSTKQLLNTTDMEASYAVLTKEEFLASVSSDGSASAGNQSPQKISNQTNASRIPFVRTQKLVDIEKYLKQRNDENIQNLLADAMLETRAPIKFVRAFYNISGISDVNVVESEWRHIDVSPKKANSSTPDNLAALLERTISIDGVDDAAPTNDNHEDDNNHDDADKRDDDNERVQTPEVDDFVLIG